MKPVAMLLLCAGLAACSSPGLLKENAPATRLATARSPSTYMTCLLPQWQSYRATASVREIRFGYRLLMPGAAGQAPEALLEVTANDAGSDVVLHRYSATTPGDTIARAVRGCL